MTRSCFSHNHMTPKEFGVYQYALAVSHTSGKFFFDGRGTASQFAGTKKDALYPVVASLEKKGWLVNMKAPTRNKLGMLTATEYQVLNHEDWEKTHAGQCRKPVGKSRQAPVGKLRQVPVAESRQAPVVESQITSLDFSTDQSANSNSPVGKPRHKYVKRVQKRETPTPNGGGAGGEKSFDQSQQLPQKSTACESDALTEQSMVDALQEVYSAKWFNAVARVDTGDGSTVPIAPDEFGLSRTLNTTGSRELFAALVDKFGITRAELDVVAEAFGDWYDSVYLPSFKEKKEAEWRNNDAEENNRPSEYVRQPIKCPLVIFRKNMKVHIDATRRYRRELAEEQSGASA